MPTGAILTVLSNIPWAQVVDNAPKAAEGAAKLWSAVTRFRRKTPPASLTTDAPAGSPPSAIEVLKSQLSSLEEMVRNLQEQMQASSELIKALADQNTQLVQGIERNRVRLLRVSVAAACSGVLLIAAIGYLFLRQ